MTVSDRVVALFVDPAGVYPSLVSEWWDVSRNAMNYSGSKPVICHPPCEAWGKFRNYYTRTRKGLEAMDDGGAFEFCLDTVNRLGGVIEHPTSSYAWKHFAGKLIGRSVYIMQGDFGFPCEKPTRLYLVNCDPNLNVPRLYATGKVENMHSAHRHYTPRNLAERLVNGF